MKLITKLQATNSNPEKKAILAGISFEEWRTFVYAYHPESMYHMKAERIDMNRLGEPSKEMFNLLDEILDGHITGNYAKDRVKRFAVTNGDLIKLIVNKDLRCGVSATTFNTVHKGSIPQFKAMKATDLPLDSLSYPMLAQLKYDGVRLIATVTDEGVTFRTYNGKKVNLPGLAEKLKKIDAINYILDGEIVYGEGRLEDRSSISGAINSAIHGGLVNETDMVFHVFDTMSRTEFEACSCGTLYMDRFRILKGLVEAADTSSIQLAITNEVHCAEGAQQLFEGALAMGYEGLVLKAENHKYEFKRSKNWVKAKAVKTADLVCNEVLGGSGKYEDMVGALSCFGMVEGKKVQVNVGSGLTDADRDKDDAEYLYKTIEIKYNSLIQDSVTKEWSLFLPRFVKVRIDK